MRSANTELVLSGLFICLCALGCKGRSLGGGEGPSPCIPGLCQGCCGADGRCHPGTSDYRCGVGGERCADCGTLGGSCEEGACIGIEECGPSNCTGCCNESGNCVDGVVSTACGSGGDECVDCGELVCEGGGCVEGCRDLDGDGYGPGCELGEDCDDLAPGIVGRCQENGCPQGWAFVPAGEFLMGCNDPGNSMCDNEDFTLDVQVETTQAYCIQVTETPVVDFRACQGSGYCGELPSELWVSSSCNWGPGSSGEDLPDHPMNCVDWVHARQFCQGWVGGDLPTEKQWVKAARGTEGYWQPWGNEPFSVSCDRCNCCWCINPEQEGGTFTWPVGHLDGPEWDSPFGLKDVCGNVSEVLRTRFDDFRQEASPSREDERVAIRGSNGMSEGTFVSFAVLYVRVHAPLMGHASSTLGFRCVREFPR